MKRTLVLLIVMFAAGCGSGTDPVLTDDGADVTDVIRDDLAGIDAGDIRNRDVSDDRNMTSDADVPGGDDAGVDAHADGDATDDKDANAISDGDSSEPVCVSSVPCAYDGDCPQGTGNRCNTALNPPRCQLLYCGEIGSPCSDNILCEQMLCTDHVCVQKPCEPNCQDIECGVDRECLLDVCGTCGDGFRCDSGACVPYVCQPDCSSRECGTEPICGTSCGTCTNGLICQSGHCVEDPCVPDCTGLECGKDPVCGKSCGSCSTGFVCDWGTCADENSCLGDNGGSCKATLACVEGCGDTSTTQGAACRNACLSKASDDGRASYMAYMSCAGEYCGDVTNAADKAACITSSCHGPEVDCFWGCTHKTCAQMQDCLIACPGGDDGCMTDCRQNSTTVAQEDYAQDVKCLFDACPLCTHADTETELEQCKDCTDDAALIECWDTWSNGTCARFGTTYTTCAGLQSCFEDCDLTTTTQTDYDDCRMDCAGLATLDTSHKLGIANICVEEECPICATDYASAECATCRAATATQDGACFSFWFICDMTGPVGCNKLTRCVSGCTSDICYQQCFGAGSQSGRTLYNAISRCFISECNDAYNEAEWTACVDATLAPGGVCKADYDACINDVS